MPHISQQDVETFAGFFIGGVLIGTLAGLPSSYGVLMRSPATVSINRLPLILRLFYSFSTSSGKMVRKKSILGRYPEIWSFIIAFGVTAYVLLGLFEAVDGELVVVDEAVLPSLSISISVMLAWLISVFGTELWLRRRWIPNNTLPEDPTDEDES